MLSARRLKLLQPHAYVVNTSRGEVIDEAALIRLLRNGDIAGAALDVFAEEPARENPLFGLEPVVATPHLGASTTEAQEKVAIQVAEQIADFLLTGAVVNAVNMPSVSAEEAARLRPYMDLANQLGSFAGQVTETAIKAVTIEFVGHAAEVNCRPLTATALQGLLAPLLETVNMVNAPTLAAQRGIEVTETKTERGGAYQSLVRLTITTERQSRAVSGTLFNGASPRIVEIKGIPMDARLGPHMLYITNDDRPGFIGALGTTLGDADINIATFNLGRDEPGGNAIALVEIDEAPPEDVLARIRALPHVVSAKPLRF